MRSEWKTPESIWPEGAESGFRANPMLKHTDKAAAPTLIRSSQLYRRTAIRLAMAFSVLFVAGVLVLFAILYFTLTNALENRLRQRVMEAQDALARVDKEQGFEDLTGVVASEAASVREADSIFLLL